MHLKNLLESLEKSFGKPFETFFAKSICRKLHSGESAFINPQGQLLSPRFFLKKWDSTKPVFFSGTFRPQGLREAGGNLTVRTFAFM